MELVGRGAKLIIFKNMEYKVVSQECHPVRTAALKYSTGGKPTLLNESIDVIALEPTLFTFLFRVEVLSESAKVPGISLF